MSYVQCYCMVPKEVQAAGMEALDVRGAVDHGGDPPGLQPRQVPRRQVPAHEYEAALLGPEHRVEVVEPVDSAVSLWRGAVRPTCWPCSPPAGPTAAAPPRCSPCWAGR